MSLTDHLFGRPLRSGEDDAEKIGPFAGVSIFGLDALGSAAYGPEAALTILIPLGVAGIAYVLPITIAIVVLLTILYFSYSQTIDAYPGGGGSYTVATENLGTFAGLFAGTALMIDYVLVAAVGISAGVGALVSAIPSWQSFTLPICLGTLVALTLVNLRGLREAGAVFIAPTYLFVVCMLAALGLGVLKTVTSGGHPVPIVHPPQLKGMQQAATTWLLLRAFSSGCTAMTGVEAVSNGVTAFRDPTNKNARLTLTIIIAILIVLLMGIAYLCRAYNIGATPPGQAGYQSVLSQLVAAVSGRDWFYYVTIGSILLVLAFQANTAFAGFPRLCRTIAQDGYLPRAFANRGRRLVYSHGIYVLAILTAFLLIIFGGVTDRLIPLFAVGAFLAFTFSQAGMVAHWRRTGGPHARRNMMINGVGAIATSITVIVVIISKFVEGAWVTLLLIPGILLVMRNVRRHYDRESEEIACPTPLPTDNLCPPMIVVPVEGWNRITCKALRSALAMSSEIIAVHIQSEEQDGDIMRAWSSEVEEPAKKAGLPVPQLVLLRSPYRYVITPIIDFVSDLEKKHPDRQIAVLVPNLVERRWYHRFLHNQRAELLTAMLLFKDNERVLVINVPWHLHA